MEHTTVNEYTYRTRKVPRIIGHKLPRTSDPCYALFMLAHFKPFHLNVPLLHPADSVSGVFRTYSFSERAVRCMSNWEAMHECEDERDAERLRKRQSLTRSSQLVTNMFVHKDLDNLVELTGRTDADNARDSKAHVQLMRLGEANFFAPSRDVPCTGSSFASSSSVSDGFKITPAMMTDWQSEIRHQEAQVMVSRLNAGDVKEQTDGSSNLPVRSTTNKLSSDDLDHDECSTPVFIPPPVVGVKATLSYAARKRQTVLELMNATVTKWKLNPEQEYAFRLMATTFVKRKFSQPSLTPSAVEPFPLRLFLTGQGGTGKTYVVQALTEVMAAFGSAHAVRFVAPTGSAASNNDGMTVHKAFGLRVIHCYGEVRRRRRFF